MKALAGPYGRNELERWQVSTIGRNGKRWRSLARFRKPLGSAARLIDPHIGNDNTMTRRQ